jgi:predicted acyltransferase
MVEQSKRLVSLDVFRGATIALMILVNTPGSWKYVYAPLRHAAWHGCTPTDLVFPFFLFIVGVAMWFAFGKYDHSLNKESAQKVLKRTFLIFLIGLLMNWYPFWDRPWETLRIMGVFQRIALAYGLASLLVLTTNKKQQIWSAAGILIAYWLLMLVFGGDDPFGKELNLARRIDLFILGEKHLYKGFGLPFDPEGLFNTLPAVVTVLMGYWTGQFIQETKDRLTVVNELYFYGLISLAAGVIWGAFFPINKALWTSSYVLYTGGWALVVLAFMITLIDLKGYQGWTKPFVVFGTNPLFVYVLSVIWVKTAIYLMRWTNAEGDTVTFLGWLYNNVFVPIAGNMNGSLLFAISHIVVYWLILSILYKKKIFIKI